LEFSDSTLLSGTLLILSSVLVEDHKKPFRQLRRQLIDH
jgi:hypothetical protein